MGCRMVSRWEYKTIKLFTTQSTKEWDDELGYWGNEGWELISMSEVSENIRVTFKRLLPIEIIKTKPEPWTDHGWNGK